MQHNRVMNMLLLVFIYRSILRAEAVNMDSGCGNANEPLKQMCFENNATKANCYDQRIRNDCGKSLKFHWTSVCAFSPSGARDEVRLDFLTNFRNNGNAYNCTVSKRFEHVQCISTQNRNFNFTSYCYYTFYECRGDSMKCHENFPNSFTGEDLL